jgi:hypothetical protein
MLYIYIYIFKYMCNILSLKVHTHINMYTYIDTHTYICIYISTHTYIYKYISNKIYVTSSIVSMTRTNNSSRCSTVHTILDVKKHHLLSTKSIDISQRGIMKFSLFLYIYIYPWFMWLCLDVNLCHGSGVYAQCVCTTS